MQVISEFNIGHKKNSIHYPVEHFLVQFWRQQEKKTHGQNDWLIDWLLLQFTTARLITNYDDLLLQFTIDWLLQFSTTVITIYDGHYNLRHYYNSRKNSCYTGRFATTIFTATQRCDIGTMLCSLETMAQQHCNAVLR